MQQSVGEILGAGEGPGESHGGCQGVVSQGLPFFVNAPDCLSQVMNSGKLVLQRKMRKVGSAGSEDGDTFVPRKDVLAHRVGSIE